MSLVKSSTHKGGYIYECTCGEHMIRIYKDEPSENFPAFHSLEFWEHRGCTQWSILGRIVLAARILIGKTSKYATYDVLIQDEDIDALADAIKSLKITEEQRITIKEFEEKILG